MLTVRSAGIPDSRGLPEAMIAKSSWERLPFHPVLAFFAAQQKTVQNQHMQTCTRSAHVAQVFREPDLLVLKTNMT